MYVVYEAPLQMLSDTPSNYLREPETMEFLAPVPTVWDETKVLDAQDFAICVVGSAKRFGLVRWSHDGLDSSRSRSGFLVSAGWQLYAGLISGRRKRRPERQRLQEIDSADHSGHEIENTSRTGWRIRGASASVRITRATNGVAIAVEPEAHQ